MQLRNHRSVHLVIHKHAHRIESRGETSSLLVQMRLEKSQLVTRSIRRVEKFPVVFFCAEDRDIHRSISAIRLAITTELKRAPITTGLPFFIAGLADSSCKTNTFLSHRGGLDEKQSKKQKGSLDSQRESSRQ